MEFQKWEKGLVQKRRLLKHTLGCSDRCLEPARVTVGSSLRFALGVTLRTINFLQQVLQPLESQGCPKVAPRRRRTQDITPSGKLFHVRHLLAEKI